MHEIPNTLNSEMCVLKKYVFKCSRNVVGNGLKLNWGICQVYLFKQLSVYLKREK